MTRVVRVPCTMALASAAIRYDQVRDLAASAVGKADDTPEVWGQVRASAEKKPIYCRGVYGLEANRAENTARPPGTGRSARRFRPKP